MPTYRWQGLSTHGKVVSGVLDAANEDILESTLLKLKVSPLAYSVHEAANRRRLPRRHLRLSARELGLLTREVGVIIKAGLPVVRAVGGVQAQNKHTPLAALLGGLRTQLESGESLTSALRTHPRLFNRLYTAMVAAGEATGDLERVLAQLAAHLERSSEVRAKLQTALLYPALVVVVASTVTGALLVFVVPVFAELFQSFGHDLPWPTRVVIRLSALATDYAAVVAAALLAGAFVFRRVSRTPAGRKRIDRICLRLPVLGPALRRAEIAKLARVLGTVITAGVPLLESLRLAADAANNTAYYEALAQTEVQVREGQALAETLANSGLFPDDVCQLVAIGESTGTLESSLVKVAELYEAEVDHLLSNLTALIEPVFIAVLGVVVGAILISMYLPIFQIGSLVQ